MKMKKIPPTNRKRGEAGRRPPLESRLAVVTPIFQSFYIQEPKLVFGSGQLTVDPKAGLEAYGPFGWENQPGKTVQIGVIGTGTGIQSFLNFLETCQSPVKPGLNNRRKPLDPHTHPDFPGCNRDQSFRCQFVSNNRSLHRTIHEDLFAKAVANATEEANIRAVVDLVIRELKALNDLEPGPDVVVVLLPPDVEHEVAHVGAAMARRKISFSPRERFLAKLKKEETKGQGLLGLDFDLGIESKQDGYWNIHHAFKAHAMQFDIPTQLVWESTLREEHLSSVAWNLFTALYYKAGNNPWRLQLLPDNTCYVGIGFYKERPFGKSDMHTSLAQVFGAGEGIVLQGGKAVVDKLRGDNKPHLTEISAETLITTAIERYTLQHGAGPARVVVHKTSRYWPEEIKGLKKGLQGIYHYDLLAFGDLDTRFMRLGKRPVLRGTAVLLAKHYYLLFTNGYIPYLRSYPSKRIPRPLEILEHHGASTPYTVCAEILSLTKLNWNSCSFGSSLPITIRFSKDVGRVLAELPKDGRIKAQSKYRFYM